MASPVTMNPIDNTPTPETFFQKIKKLKISNNKTLSDNFINKILNLIKIDENSRYNLIELTGIVNKMGEENTLTLLEQNQSLPLEQIIKKSDAFLTQRKRLFANLTHTLRDRTKISGSIMKCPKCKSNNVETRTVQARSADEPMTDKYYCNNCGNRWSKN